MKAEQNHRLTKQSKGLHHKYIRKMLRHNLRPPNRTYYSEYNIMGDSANRLNIERIFRIKKIPRASITDTKGICKSTIFTSNQDYFKKSFSMKAGFGYL